ncbi:MAG: YHS domain-containing protein [Candidatus Omnitrophica bacterium]|nr:YHS domain-containing protein [Candidatus Omnitrophota bacterium]
MRKIAFFSLLFVLVMGVGSLFALSCGDKDGQPGNDPQLQKMGCSGGMPETDGSCAAVNAGNKICPVSGDKINEDTKATYEYNGKAYNLCCAACVDEFKKDPEKYAKKVEEELQAGQNQMVSK